jgi:hypothetical protein
MSSDTSRMAKDTGAVVVHVCDAQGPTCWKAFPFKYSDTLGANYAAHKTKTASKETKIVAPVLTNYSRNHGKPIPYRKSPLGTPSKQS